MRSRTDVAAVLAAAILLASPASAQLKPAASTTPPPAEIAASLKALFGADGLTVSRGQTTIELWWVKALAVTGAADWSGVAEGTLVGAMRVAGPFREIRGKTIKPGVYTLRYGRQPQNGDHLGASPFREFLLLSPAELDTDPKPLGFEGTNAISKQTIATSHPAALSVDPPVATEGLLSLHKSELDHDGVIVEVQTSAGKPLRFGLILVGVITP